MNEITELPDSFDIDEQYELWLKIGRSTERCDRPNIEDAIRSIYEFGGEKAPEVILWAESPMSVPKVLSEYSGEDIKSIKEELYKSLYSWYFGGSIGTSYWVAYYDAARQIGVSFTEEQNKALNAMMVLTGCGYWFPFEGVAVACEKPIQINVDAQGQLHNEEGPSMLFADGYSLWHIHGVPVPQSVIEHPELITASDIFNEDNSEVRRVMCERMGWDKFIIQAKLELISECPDPGNFDKDGSQRMLRLYKTPELIEGTAVNLLHCINGTPKPNGVVPQYGITTPIDILDPLEAAAWVANMPVEMYAQISRRT